MMILNKPLRSLQIMAVFILTQASPSVRVLAEVDVFKQSAELGSRTAKTSDDVREYVGQLDKTEKALFLLTQAQGKDLRKRYESFSKEVSKLKQAQDLATSDINAMTSKGAAYFSSWSASIAQISDEQLRQASTERRTMLMKEHDELAARLHDIGTQLQPFMSDLQDINTFLRADLSPANASNANGMIQKSQTDARLLKERIAVVQAMLKQFLSQAPK